MTPILASDLSNGRYVCWVIVTVGTILYAPFFVGDLLRVARWVRGRIHDRRVARAARRHLSDLDSIARHDQARTAATRTPCCRVCGQVRGHWSGCPRQEVA